MDHPTYFTDLLVRDRLAGLRAEAARLRLVAQLRGAPRWRVALGTALVKAGERLRGCAPVGGLATPRS